MKIIGTLLITLFALTAARADSGGETQNGGYGVVCENPLGTTESVRLFDYWEMAQIYGGRPLDLGAPTLTLEQKVALVVNRVRLYDSEIANEIGNNANIILTQIPTILADTVTGDPNDDHSYIFPTAPCFKRLFAAQIRDPGAAVGRYKIRRDYWNLASADHQAGIVLHEAIYRTFIKLGAKDSDGVREFNFVFSSQVSQNYTVFDFQRLMNKIRIPMTYGSVMEFVGFPGQIFWGRQEGGTFLLNKAATLSNSSFRANLSPYSEIHFSRVTGKVTKIENYFSAPISGQVKSGNRTVEFEGPFQLHENESMKSFKLKNDALFDIWGGTINCRTEDLSGLNQSVYLHANGQLERCSGRTDSPVVLPVYGSVVADLGTFFLLEPDGTFSSLRLKNAINITLPNLTPTLNVISLRFKEGVVSSVTLRNPLVVPNPKPEGGILAVNQISRDMVRNVYRGEGVVKLIDPKVNGSIILENSSTLACLKLGYSDGVKEHTQAETRAIAGSATVYNPNNNQTFTVVDDTVRVFTQIGCTLKIDLN
jgi:hypothetical protein